MEPVSDQARHPRLRAAARAALVAAALGGGLFALSQLLAPQSASAETVHEASTPAGPTNPGSGAGRALARTTAAIGGLVTGTLGTADAAVADFTDAATGAADPAPVAVPSAPSAPAPAAQPATATASSSTAASPTPTATAAAPAAETPAAPASAAAPAPASGGSLLGGTLAQAGGTLGATTDVVTRVVRTVGGLALEPVQAGVAASDPQLRQRLADATAPTAGTLAALDAAHPASRLVGGLALTIDDTLLLVERMPVLGPLLGGVLGEDPATGLLAPTARALDGTVQTIGSQVTDTLRAHPTEEASVAGTPGPVASVDAGAAAGRMALDALAALLRAPLATLGAHRAVLAAGVAATTAALAAVGALLTGLPGLPGLPFAPLELAAAGAGTVAGGRGARGDRDGSVLTALFGREAATPDTARTAHHGEPDALPASPVSDHDSTPD